MKKEEIIEQIRVYQSMSNMDLLDIIEEISGCEFKPMNSPEHVIVFDTVETNESWFIALKTIGTKSRRSRDYTSSISAMGSAT